jgi:hypothetical protein
MKPLSIGVGLFWIVALAVAITGEDATSAVLAAGALLCAFATFIQLSNDIELPKILISIFSTETIVFGVAVLAGKIGLWPPDYGEYLPPVSLPMAVAIFSILVYLVAQIKAARQINGIADPLFQCNRPRRGAHLAIACRSLPRSDASLWWRVSRQSRHRSSQNVGRTDTRMVRVAHFWSVFSCSRSIACSEHLNRRRQNA